MAETAHRREVAARDAAAVKGAKPERTNAASAVEAAGGARPSIDSTVEVAGRSDAGKLPAAAQLLLRQLGVTLAIVGLHVGRKHRQAARHVFARRGPYAG